MIVRSDKLLGHSPRGGATIRRGENRIEGAILDADGRVTWTSEAKLTRAERVFVEMMIRMKQVVAIPDPPPSETRLVAGSEASNETNASSNIEPSAEPSAEPKIKKRRAKARKEF